MGVCGCRERSALPDFETSDEKLKLKMLVTYIQALAEAKKQPADYKIFRSNINRDLMQGPFENQEFTEQFLSPKRRSISGQEYVAGRFVDKARLFTDHNQSDSDSHLNDFYDCEVRSNEELEPAANSLFNPIESLQFRDQSAKVTRV